MLRRALVLMAAFTFVAFVTACGGDSGGTPGNDTTQTETQQEVADETADETSGEKDTTCDPQCGDKVCGPSACEGVTCGTCPNATDTCTDGACIACDPACGDKVCGPSECMGIDCGTCESGKICNAGACEAPDAFGIGSAASKVFLPKTADVTGEAGTPLEGAACLDMDGDGQPNNGLGGLIDTVESLGGIDVNAELQGMIDEGTMGILLEFPADTALPTYGPFTLNGFLGKPDANPGEWLVDPQSYDPETGKPMVYMEGSQITNGALVCGPGDFSFSIPVMGMVLNLKISKAQIHGTVVAADAAGVEFTGGAIAGEIFKEDVITAIEGAKAYCAAQGADAPKECSYLDMVSPELLDTFITWDLDDGTGVSACLFVSGVKAKINGLAPVEEPAQ